MNEKTNSQKVSDVYKDRWEKKINFKKSKMKVQDSKHKHKIAWSVFLTCFSHICFHNSFSTCTYSFILGHYFMQVIKGREEKILRAHRLTVSLRKALESSRSMRRCLSTDRLGEHLLKHLDFVLHDTQLHCNLILKFLLGKSIPSS